MLVPLNIVILNVDVLPPMLAVMTTMLAPTTGAITTTDANMRMSYVMITMHVQQIVVVPPLDVNSII
jgi:hypothetical protein